MISVFVSLTLPSLGQSGKRRLKVARIGRGAGSDGEAIAIFAERTVDPFDIALVSGNWLRPGKQEQPSRPFFREPRRGESQQAKVDRAGTVAPPPARLDTAGTGRDAGVWVARGSSSAPGPLASSYPD